MDPFSGKNNHFYVGRDQTINQYYQVATNNSDNKKIKLQDRLKEALRQAEGINLNQPELALYYDIAKAIACAPEFYINQWIQSINPEFSYQHVKARLPLGATILQIASEMTFVMDGMMYCFKEGGGGRSTLFKAILKEYVTKKEKR